MSHNRNPKPPYPPEFRQQMVEQVAAGRCPSELAKECGCHETSILTWVRRAQAAHHRCLICQPSCTRANAPI